jgi:hypothetical protein
MEALPFSIAQAIENEGTGKSHFPVPWKKRPGRGVYIYCRFLVKEDIFVRHVIKNGWWSLASSFAKRFSNVFLIANGYSTYTTGDSTCAIFEAGIFFKAALKACSFKMMPI